MSSKRKRLRDCRLYAIINRPFFDDIPGMVRAARDAAEAGAGIIQLRDKDSCKKEVLKAALLMKKSLYPGDSLLIVNDHADIVLLSKADGLHIGQSDLPLPEARKLLGAEKIIGVSCLSLAQALKAEKEGADYIGVGPVFPTSTKTDCAVLGPEFLAAVCKKIRIPVFAIGGINEKNIDKVLSLGADGAAVSSAICCATDKAAATRRFTNILSSYDTVRTREK